MVIIGPVISWPLTCSDCSVWYWIREAPKNICPPPPPVRAVSIGSLTGWPVELVVLVTVQGTMAGLATPYPCFAVMVWSGSPISWPRNSPAWLTTTKNGFADLTTNLSTPLATRRMVLGRSGRWAEMPYFSRISSRVSKMEGQGRLQSMISAALRQGSFFPVSTSGLSAGACVGSGHTMGCPSQRAIRKNRFLVVGAP